MILEILFLFQVLDHIQVLQMQHVGHYKLRIISGGKGEKIANIDLIETFNYLAGLKVSKYKFLNEKGIYKVDENIIANFSINNDGAEIDSYVLYTGLAYWDPLSILEEKFINMFINVINDKIDYLYSFIYPKREFWFRC